MMPVIVQRLLSGRDRAEYCGPCGPAATSGLVEGASDSVHRQSQWTFQFLRDGYAFSVGIAAIRRWPFFALLQLSGVERQFSEPSMVKSSLPSRAPAQKLSVMSGFSLVDFLCSCQKQQQQHAF